MQWKWVTEPRGIFRFTGKEQYSWREKNHHVLKQITKSEMKDEELPEFKWGPVDWVL